MHLIFYYKNVAWEFAKVEIRTKSDFPFLSVQFLFPIFLNPNILSHFL